MTVREGDGRAVTTASLLQDSQEQPEAEAPPPEEAASDIDRSQLPPVARNLYDNAVNDIINNILRNI